jgi:hypothetical protein
VKTRDFETLASTISSNLAFLSLEKKEEPAGPPDQNELLLIQLKDISQGELADVMTDTFKKETEIVPTASEILAEDEKKDDKPAENAQA